MQFLTPAEQTEKLKQEGNDLFKKSPTFLRGVANVEQLPVSKSYEFAFAGRSNVGKSSLINAVTMTRGLARASNTPGRTQELNFFDVDGQCYIVDLPGYGYAKVAKGEKAKWGAMIEGYLTGSGNLKNVFVLLDIRHKPTDDDKMMVNFLFHYNIPFTLIATKADKLSRMQQMKNRQMLASEMGVGVENVYLTSSLNKTGKEAIFERIGQILG